MAALAATGVYAQSSVSVGGLLDIGWKTQSHKGTSGTGAKAAGISDGATGPNRLLFQGTEDLGGGLKAMFVSEIGINPTNDELTGNRTGSSGIQYDSALTTLTPAQVAALPQGASGYSQNTNRQTWVGVSGGFGQVRAGYLVNNFYVLSSQSGYNMTFEGLVGADFAHTQGMAQVGGARGNGLQWTTPELLKGLTTTLQYGTGGGRQTLETQNGTTKDNVDRTSLALTYAQGPLRASYGYTTAKTVTTGSILSYNAQGELLGQPANANSKATAHQLLGAYDFGVARVAVLMNTAESKNNLTNAVTDLKSQQITVRVPVGGFNLVASTGKATTEAAGAKTANIKGHQFGATYALSKRSTMYALTGQTEDTGTSRSAWHAKRSSTAVGIAHTF